MSFIRDRLIFLTFFITIAFGFGFVFGMQVDQAHVRNSPVPTLSSLVSGTGGQQSAPLDLSLVWEVFDNIRQYYYGYNDISSNEMVRGMARGLVDSLKDKHSEYFDPVEKQDFNNTLSGDFQGIGAVVTKVKEGVSIETIIPKSPAEQVGLLMGDTIVRVDSKDISDLTVNQAVEKIRGPAGTKVTLDIVRKDKNGDYSGLEKTVVRQHVDVPSIDSKMLDNGVAMISLSIFGEHTADDFMKALDDLMIKKPTGLIIDLRGNTGGYLDAAVDILGHFIDKGKPVVTVKERNTADNKTYTSKGTDVYHIPVVVLVNGNSASASEITAGALHDDRIAIIVGENTYGKGSVQQVFDLGENGQMKITIARWYTPNDTNIDKVGIAPDVVVPFRDKDIANHYDRQLEEAKKVLAEFIKTKDIQKAIDASNARLKAENPTASGATTESGATGSGSNK